MASEKIGRYEVLGKIGEGGMGIVYRVHDPALGRDVALKLLRPELSFNQGLVERFMSEARMVAALEHDHVVTIHEVGEADGLPYFTMQYIDGQDLATMLHQRGRFALSEALPILQQVAEALDYAHRKGIIHRDVKPENVLIDPEGRARVMDFGIARAGESQRLTTTGTMLGTPEYMSPEQAQGLLLDHRSDLYSLGIVAYELLTGRTPFGDQAATTTPLAMALRHIREEPNS